MESIGRSTFIPARSSSAGSACAPGRRTNAKSSTRESSATSRIGRAGYYEARIVPEVRLTDADRLAHIALTISTGPRVRVCSPATPCRRTNATNWSRCSAKDRSTRICSRTPVTGLKSCFARKGIATRCAAHARRSERRTGDHFTIKRGQQYRVTTYEISGNASLPLAEFAALLRLAEGQPFSSARLDADVSTIEELYHRRGFASARAVSASKSSTPAAAPIPVIARIVVNEGVRTAWTR